MNDARNEFEADKYKARAKQAEMRHKHLDVVSRVVPLVAFLAWTIIYFLMITVGDQHYCLGDR